MGLWTIQGGRPLYGTARVQGSKNGALGILAGCLAVSGVSVLENVPRVTEVDVTLEILRGLGCKVKREGERVIVDSRTASMESIPISLMAKQRSSLLFLGAMLARFGTAAVPMLTGGVLGPRPVDLHLAAMQAMGANVLLYDGMIACEKSDLHGGEVVLPYPSVGATENAMLAACGCRGATVLRGCAKEPEVADLAVYLRAAGMEITGEGTDTMYLCPKGFAGRVHHKVLPDRTEAALLLCAAAACGGELNLNEVIPSHLQAVLDVLEEMGCNIKIYERSLSLISDGRLWAPACPIVTGPYPAFPTDVLPLMMAACLKADSVTVLQERVFGGRFRQGKQLRRFGGDVSLTDDCTAMVTGVGALHGVSICTYDPLEAGAVLISALQADGETTVVDHGRLLDSFAFLDAVLRTLGAELEFTQ